MLIASTSTVIARWILPTSFSYRLENAHEEGMAARATDQQAIRSSRETWSATQEDLARARARNMAESGCQRVTTLTGRECSLLEDEPLRSDGRRSPRAGGGGDLLDPLGDAEGSPGERQRQHGHAHGLASHAAFGRRRAGFARGQPLGQGRELHLRPPAANAVSNSRRILDIRAPGTRRLNRATTCDPPRFKPRGRAVIHKRRKRRRFPGSAYRSAIPTGRRFSFGASLQRLDSAATIPLHVLGYRSIHD